MSVAFTSGLRSPFKEERSDLTLHYVLHLIPHAMMHVTN
jgi:hypothetical protein